ncbi:hypothetical protein [Nocardia sp. CDC160]|uniref:hypothetical protein n=1 Tax=Nocardia sp. CDC160 TaxID=3112166 RepID=UPI002DBE0CDF|nr:hypothetical protein [Nocardia sp. CDC160]MEC3920674.1 hypothetical protein [Nocardia sp. CDC160]
MNQIAVVPDEFDCYGAVCHAMGAYTAAAGTVDSGAVLAGAMPVFGLIGQDFVAALGFAQTNFLESVLQLAGVHFATATVAHEAATGYRDSEYTSGVGLEHMV